MSQPSPQRRTLRFLHANDSYCAWSDESRDICGGGARFVAAIKSYREGGHNYNGHDPLALNGGDLFFPSTASQSTLGKHMVPILNEAGFKAATIGNHEMDQGLEVLEQRIQECNFPWLLANVKCKEDGSPLVTSEDYVILDHDGLKVGVIGVGEEEWIASLGVVDAEDLAVEDFVACVKRLVPQMRAEGADLIVALTHMRVPNDRRLAEEAGELIDIILGGHDHHYEVTPFMPKNAALAGVPESEHPRQQCWMVKSGTDFRDFTVIDVQMPLASEAVAAAGFTDLVRPKPQFCFKRVTIRRHMPEDPIIVEALKADEERIQSRMKKVIGKVATELDCRFTSVRTRETNVGNFVADTVRCMISPHPDVALINSGCLRTDGIVPVGDYTIGDLCRMLPFLSQIAVIRVTGDQLLEALENGVGKVPALEGRFPCISGMRFQYDPNAPSMERVVPGSIMIGDKPCDGDKVYTLATLAFIASGKEGYDVFANCPHHVETENLPQLSQTVQNFFIMQKCGNTGSLKKSGPGAGAMRNVVSVASSVKSMAMKWARKTKESRAAEKLSRRVMERVATSVAGGGASSAFGGATPSAGAGLGGDDEEEPASPTSLEPASPTTAAQAMFRLCPRVDGRITDVSLIEGGAAIAMAAAQSMVLSPDGGDEQQQQPMVRIPTVQQSVTHNQSNYRGGGGMGDPMNTRMATCATSDLGMTNATTAELMGTDDVAGAGAGAGAGGAAASKNNTGISSSSSTAAAGKAGSSSGGEKPQDSSTWMLIAGGAVVAAVAAGAFFFLRKRQEQ